MWSLGGQWPYEYIKDYCEWHVNYLQTPPPTVLLNQF